MRPLYSALLLGLLAGPAFAAPQAVIDNERVTVWDVKLAPGEEFHDVEPGAVNPDAAQLVELSHLRDRRVVGDAEQRPALVLEGADPRRVGEDRLPLAR